MIIILGILATLFVVIVFSLINKKRREKKVKIQIASDKIREEALDKLILNKETEIRKDEKTFAAVPVVVNYDVNSIEKINAFEKKKTKRKKVMVQILENSELSARKYVFDPRKGIFLGSKVGKNHIVVSDSDIDERQCEIRENAGNVYVRNIGISGKLVLRRQKQSVYVEQKYLEIKTGDILVVGNVIYKVDLIITNER